MKATQLRGPTPGQLIARLVGEDCQRCEDGTNEQGEHKGYSAAICDTCGWIAARMK